MAEKTLAPSESPNRDNTRRASPKARDSPVPAKTVAKVSANAHGDSPARSVVDGATLRALREELRAFGAEVLQHELEAATNRIEQVLRQEMQKHAHNLKSYVVSRERFLSDLHASSRCSTPRSTALSDFAGVNDTRANRFIPQGVNNSKKIAQLAEASPIGGRTSKLLTSARQIASSPRLEEEHKPSLPLSSKALSTRQMKMTAGERWESDGEDAALNAASADEADSRTCFQRLAAFVQSELFDRVIGIIIFANAVLTGIQTDYLARNWSEEIPFHFTFLEYVFCFMYTVEMTLRAMCYGATFVNYVQNNLIDVSVVVVQIVDMGCLLFFRSKFRQHPETVLRMLRFFRLIRILRLARLLSLIMELRMLIVSVLDSMRALLWTVTLIGLVLYMFAVYFTQLITDYKVHHKEEIKEEQYILDELYGSLGRTMLCFYEAICDGRHWDSMLEPVMEYCSPWLSILFMGFITICIVGVMNMVTSVFVTTAMQKVDEDKKEVLMLRMQAFFQEADEDKSGSISWDEFKEHMENPQMLKFLKEIDLSPEQSSQLFRLLDPDQTLDVAIDDIVKGCVHLHGPAKALDHANMMFTLENFVARFKEHQSFVESCFSSVMEHFGIELNDGGRRASEVNPYDL